MALRINYNLAASVAQRSLATSQDNYSRQAERLSTGLRINKAGDDAAGMAVSERLKNQVRGLKVGDVVEGTVISVKPYGAFVDIGGASGLLHISQIARERVNAVSDYLKEGQSVRVKVLEADDKGRVRLSMKALKDKQGAAAGG